MLEMFLHLVSLAQKPYPKNKYAKNWKLSIIHISYGTLCFRVSKYIEAE